MANIAITFAGKVFVNKPIVGVPDGLEGFFKSIRLKENSVNLRRANTSVGGVSFSLVDLNREITKLLAENRDYFLNRPVSVRVGTDDQSFDQLTRLPGTFITSVSHDSNKYDFQASDILFLLNKSLNEIPTRATDGGDESAVEIEADTTNFPESGILRMGDELLSYLTKTDTAFQNVTRGIQRSEPAVYDRGDEILLVSHIQSDPITAILTLMNSRSGEGGLYDTARHGMGIPLESIDLPSFEKIRDDHFSMDEVNLFFWQDEEFLRVIETEILQLTNCRIIQNGDKIGLAILGSPAESEKIITDRQMESYGKTSVKYSDIINRIRVEYGYNWGTNKFTQIEFYRDEDSITQFGESKEIVYRFRGATEAAPLQRMATNYFFRFARPNPQLNIKTNFEAFDILPGDNVLLDSSIIPSESGELGFHNVLEVLKKSVDALGGKIGLTLAFGSYDNAIFQTSRISPVARIESISMNRQGFVFKVHDASLFRPGYKVRRFFRDVTTYGDPTDYYGVSFYDNGEGLPSYDNLTIEQGDTYGNMNYGNGNYGRLHRTDGVIYTVKTADRHTNEMTFEEVVHASPGQLFEFADFDEVSRPGQTSQYAYIEEGYLIS